MSKLKYQPYDAAGNQYGQLTRNAAPACNACRDQGVVAVMCRDGNCMTLHIRDCEQCPRPVIRVVL